MFLNFRIFLLLICTQIVWSQEENIVKDTIDIRTYETFFELNYTQPTFYGNNFINEGYDLQSGFSIGITTSFIYKTTLHIDLSIHSGDVTRPELVGNISSSNFTRLSFGFGYPLKVSEKFTFLPSLHYGYIKLGHDVPNSSEEDRLRDDGAFVGIKAQLNYRIIEWLDINVGIIQQFDFLSIQTAPQEQSFFDNAQSIYPSIGLRFRIDSHSKDWATSLWKRKDDL